MSQIVISGLAVVLFAAGAVAQNSGYATYSNINGGVCSGVSSGLPAVSMNAAQFGGGAACGQCVQIQGTGNGAGTTPVSTAPYIAVINNVCPSCAVGDIDLQESGSGKFGITWSFVACPGAGRRLIEGRKMIADTVQPAAEVPEVVEQESQEATAEQPATREESVAAAPAQAEPVQQDAPQTEEAPETEESSQAAAAPSQEEAAAPAADPAEVPAVEEDEVAAPAASPAAAQDVQTVSRRMLR